MADDENFLKRWSRRKRETSATAERPEPAASQPQRAAEPLQARDEPPPATGSAATREPSFDIAKLPSLDSITAATDVRAFLAPGVPPELTRAALRRAWETDPAIRDFVGLQEYDWDFNGPTKVAGFGALPPDLDLKKMVSELLGESEPARNTADIPAVHATPEPPPTCAQAPTNAGPSPASLTAHDDVRDNQPNEQLVAHRQTAQDDKNTAPQHMSQRKHGGALPE